MKREKRNAKTGVFIFTFFFFLISIFYFSCTPQQAATPAPGAITDALGRHFVPQDAQRIVSLVPAVTEILFAIGAGDRVVGVTQHCDYPPEARFRTSVGGFAGVTVSLEQVSVLRPDLVIISADMHARLVSLLDNLRIPSFAVEPRNFSQVFDTIMLIGEISGSAKGAGDLILQMKEKIELVNERLQGRERVAVFFLLEENPLMSVGSGTFISEALTLGGGINIFEDVDELWPLVSPEQVLLRRPEWIFVGDDMGEVPSLQGPFWQSLSAVREGRVEVIPADLLFRFGPRLADGVITISEILHPFNETVTP